jgi:DNA mismatch repair protein MutH
MSEADILRCREFYYHVRSIVKDGIILTPTCKGTRNNLPLSKDHPILHIRPHAQNSNDRDMLPDGQFITKQSFWINKSYILEIISGNEY